MPIKGKEFVTTAAAPMCATKKRARDADAGPSSEPFSKHPAGAAQKPLPKSATILQRVVHALRARGGASSAPAIVKAVAEGGYTDGAKVRKAIKAGVTAGALQTSAESAAKFWVGGEPIPEAAAGPAVATEELSPGDAGGSPVAKGDAVAIDYTLSLLATGEKVEAGKKFCFTVGGGDVIKDMHRVGLDTVRGPEWRPAKGPTAPGGTGGSVSPHLPISPPHLPISPHISRPVLSFCRLELSLTAAAPGNGRRSGRDAARRAEARAGAGGAESSREQPRAAKRSRATPTKGRGAERRRRGGC